MLNTCFLFLTSVRGSDVISRDVVSRLDNPHRRMFGCADDEECRDTWTGACNCVKKDAEKYRIELMIREKWPNGEDGPLTETDTYWWVGRGHCSDGYYKGWTDDANHATMGLMECAALCDSEPECMYFSYRVGRTCSRYTEVAKECALVDDAVTGWYHSYTWRKKDFKVPRPEVGTFKYLPGYEYVAQGYCQSGYYKGWGADADQASMTVEKCKAHCDAEPNCAYFSVSEGGVGGKTCSRYSTTVSADLATKGCRTDLAHWAWASTYGSYKKVADDCPIERNVDFNGNDLLVGGSYGRFKGWLPSAEACRKVCDSMSACKSWTYVKSEPVGRDNCALKTTTPSEGHRRTNAPCCDSGAPCRG